MTNRPTIKFMTAELWRLKVLIWRIRLARLLIAIDHVPGVRNVAAFVMSGRRR